jgi:non-canonical poly(A) RNA polymerase PAPD5/7
VCSSIEPIKSAKCPIIKLTDKQTGINVDISFNRENGIHCVHLVKQLMRKYPELKPLLLVLKCFLKSRQLNETYHGGVSSFLLTMLVVSHLQRQYKRFGKHVEVDLGKHLIDFFELYGTLFNYEDVGISIRSGYFPKESRGWEGWDERSKFRLCVENPQDQSVDIGKASYNIKRVQRAFQHAYDTLIFNNSSSLSLLKLIITCDAGELRPQRT